MPGLFGVPTRLQSGQLLAGVGELGLQLLQTFLGGRVLGLLQLHFLHFKTGDPAAQLVDLLGRGVEFHAQVRGGLVHQIDGLVRQLTAGNVAIRQGRGGHQRIVADGHLVVCLVTLLQAAQNGDGVLDGRLAHKHLLEAAFQRRVLFDVLAVFVQRGRANQAQLATCQHGLEHIARVHRAFRSACADDGVNLVDEGDDLPVRVLDLLKHGFQAFLEFATVFRAGHHRTQVKADEFLALQGGGHVAGDDALRQAFDHGCFADARLADQHRIVLGASRQNLDDAANLLVAPDHRVEFAVLGLGRQIGGVFLQRLVATFRVGTGHFRAAAHAGHRLAQGGCGDVIGLQDARRLVGRGRRDADEQMLGGDVFVAHRLHFLLGGRHRRRELTAGLWLRSGRTRRTRQ